METPIPVGTAGDLDGDGVAELVVQVGDIVGVRFSPFEWPLEARVDVVLPITVSVATSHADLDGDGLDELFSPTPGGWGSQGSVEIWSGADLRAAAGR